MFIIIADRVPRDRAAGTEVHFCEGETIEAAFAEFCRYRDNNDISKYYPVGIIDIREAKK